VYGRRRAQPAWRQDLRPAAVLSLPTPIGELFVAACEDGVVASSFDERGFMLEVAQCGFEAVFLGAPAEAEALAGAAREELKRYFDGTPRNFSVPVELGRQTEFSRAVLEETAAIPYGETVTYAEIGERAGRLRAARAVGNILASCPFNVIVPCHRVVHALPTADEVVSAQGSPSRKAWLLQFERTTKQSGSRLKHDAQALPSP